MNQIKYEAVLIWSTCPSDDPSAARQFKAFNKCFDEVPDDTELAVMVGNKHEELEAEGLPNLAFHELQLRTVHTEKLDLEAIVNSYNETHYPEEA